MGDILKTQVMNILSDILPSESEWPFTDILSHTCSCDTVNSESSTRLFLHKYFYFPRLYFQILLIHLPLFVSERLKGLQGPEGGEGGVKAKNAPL